jgi:hypothetical protein
MHLEIHLFRASILATKRLIGSLLLLCAAALFTRPASAGPDILYVGDATTIVDPDTGKALDSINLVRRFEAETGKEILGGNPAGVYFVPPVDSNDLDGPRGIFQFGDALFVGSQNITKTGTPGQILRYKVSDGRPDGVFVRSSKDPFTLDAPFTPDGMVCWKGVVISADLTTNEQDANGNFPLGRLLAYDAQTGKLLRQFNPPEDFIVDFHPRGVVIGPNGLLYVANMPNLIQPRLGGQILVFDPETFDFLGIFINDPGGVNALNRPDGIVFGPDGNLYVASFRAHATDADAIRIYDGHTGVYLDEIELYMPPASPPNDPNPTNPRAFAQGIIFGPGGKLFVPITGNHPSTQGRIRRYDVQTKAFDVFATVPGSPPLWYLTFGKTNPGTLVYEVK